MTTISPTTTNPPPECVNAEDQENGKNPEYIVSGVPLCATETLPDYATPLPMTTTSSQPPLLSCIPVNDKEIESNMAYIDLGIPICPEEIDDYDPNDVPMDQAEPAPDCIPEMDKGEGMNPKYLQNGVPICPSEEKDGYEYSVPEVPFTLPTKKTTDPTTTITTMSPLPECIPTEEQDAGNNPGYLQAGVPLCPSEELPGYQSPNAPASTTTAKSLPECIAPEEKDIGMNPSYIEQGIPLCPTEYEDYDPNDIPLDQAPPVPECIPVDQKDEGMNPGYLESGVPLCPIEEPSGYEYPVPEIPFTLPTKPSTTSTTTSEEMNYDDYDPSDIPDDQAEPIPDCVPVDKQNQEKNPEYIAAGTPLCPSEELPGYSYPVPENPLKLPQKVRKSKKLFDDDDMKNHESAVTESGISISSQGRVVSFRIPESLKLDTAGHKSSEQLNTDEKNAKSKNQHGDSSKKVKKPKNRRKNLAKANLHQKKKKEEINVKETNRFTKKSSKNMNKHKGGDKPSKIVNPSTKNVASNDDQTKMQVEPSKPREQKSLNSSKKGKKVISVAAWLRRGR